MEQTDMAVVVSRSQNEIEAFQKKGLDITLHRKRIVSEDLDEKFKDENNPLRIVFVCAMWMTGFDVPSCSTIYLDKQSGFVHSTRRWIFPKLQKQWKNCWMSQLRQ